VQKIFPNFEELSKGWLKNKLNHKTTY